MISAQENIAKELESIKKLLVLKLISEGFTQSQIGAVLGIDQSAVSRLVPARSSKAKKPKGRQLG